MAKYDPASTEKKWQKKWKRVTPDSDAGKKNYLLLTEFPYPSGNLHIGHWYAFALPDVLARYLRMNGKNVMYPIGFDAFGLPAENAAIQRNINPRDWTEENIKYMTTQLKSMGATFDWSREVRTIDPDYYTWTQWMFLKFYEKGLAYRAQTLANWCPKDQTVLANEQVVDGCCERCGTRVIQKEIEQWMFRITAYADRLVDDLEELDWPETTKLAQRNWIGRSEGALIKFGIKNNELGIRDIEVFTTRADTIFGATFLVVSPELGQKWINEGWAAGEDVQAYIKESLSRRALEREQGTEKTGIDSGLQAIHPLTEREIPIWIADYVLGSYGTGAIMAVPAHDERDREFADKFNLPIKEIKLEDSKKIIQELEGKNLGNTHTTYRLHDWIISRQRYWGVPIPMIKCEECGYVPVPEKDLPVKLPNLDDFKPADDGRSPLAKEKDWVNVKCPKCKGDAERETDTMDTFVDSSWYFLRYTDPKNKKEFADQEKMAAWLPVPLYIGGAEHNTMHLLYSRFFTKALYDLGHISFNEPFLARRNHGIILGPDGQKMSKSRGNVVDPDEEVKKYGADTVRMYLAFMGPYGQGGPWDPKGINGIYRFIQRVWKWSHGDFSGGEIPLAVHRAVKNISRDIQNLEFNTGVSELMKLLNAIEGESVNKETVGIFTKLLAPFAPHLAEEIWREVFGNATSVHDEPWPEYDDHVLTRQYITIPVQVNGRVRDVMTVDPAAPEDEIKNAALALGKIKHHLQNKKIIKTIYVAGRMINFVVEQ